MKRYICIHGHFYQPPRENPWLEEVEFQESAKPYHDWNERVTVECYAPNTAARIVDNKNRIVDLVNNYSKISFNIGPTLFAWIERHRPDVLEAIVAADKESRTRFSGHGCAIAQVYNHMIMPLANLQDKYTQVRWGIKDFENRFGRSPEGMWLPETAVDIETLEVLAELNIKFTILAPHQAVRIKEISANKAWINVGEKIDPTMAYLCRLPSGKSINIFFYDGPISHDIAFGNLLENGERYAERLLSAFNNSRTWPQLIHVATDGESYGHHKKFGEMALAYVLNRIELAEDVQLTNYGEYLEKNPPTHEVEILENSSWSCIHGIERWRSDCGCNMGQPGYKQTWRKPLRETLNNVRDELSPLFEYEGLKFLSDPWKARDEYLEVINDRSQEIVKKFLTRHSTHELSDEETVKVLTLLEVQRNCMLMFTSCGWFFDDLAGIETIQVLRYASKAVQDASTLTDWPLEQKLIKMLTRAPGNAVKNGAEIYNTKVKPTSVDLRRVGIHYAILSLAIAYPRVVHLYCYIVENESYKKMGDGSAIAVVGKIKIRSTILQSEASFVIAASCLSEYEINCGIKVFESNESYSLMEQEFCASFDDADGTKYLQLMRNYFGSNIYSFQHLFHDEQRQIMHEILNRAIESANIVLFDLHRKNSDAITFLEKHQQPIPHSFIVPARYVLAHRLALLFDEPVLDPAKVRDLEEKAKNLNIQLQLMSGDQARADKWIADRFEDLNREPYNIKILEELNHSFEVISTLDLDIDLWKAQNIFFKLGKTIYPEQAEKAKKNDLTAHQWIEFFSRLGEYVRVKITLTM